MVPRILIPVLLTLTAACQALTTAPAAGAVTLRLESTAVAMNRGGGEYVVPILVENGRAEPIHVPRCGGSLLVEVERREDGSWVGVQAAVCLAVYEMVAIRLEPGAAYEGHVRVSAEPGEYRLRLSLGIGDDGQRMEQVVSEVFRID